MSVYISNWIVLYPIAVSLFIVLRLAGVGSERLHGSLPVLALRLLIALMLAFALLSLGARVSVLAIFWLMLLGFGAAILLWRRRRLERMAVLTAVLSCASEPQRQRLLERFAEQNHGWLRRRAQVAHRAMLSGRHSSEALEQAGFTRGTYQTSAVRLQATVDWVRESPEFAAPRGDLRNGLLTWQTAFYIESSLESMLARLAIFAWVPIMLPLIGFVYVFVVPTILQMLEEFGVDSPSLLIWFVGISDSVQSGGPWSLLLLIPIGLLIVLGIALMVWIFPSLISLPPFRWLAGPYHLTLAFMTLSRVFRQQPSFAQALYQTSQLLPIGYLSQRILQAARHIEAGQSPIDALRSNGLLSRREYNAFSSFLAGPELIWGLEQVSAAKVERMLGRYSVIIQVLVVSLTLLLAICVGAISISILQVLAQIAEGILRTY